MKKVSCVTCPTASCFIKKCCTKQWIEKADQGKSQVIYKKNQRIIYEGTHVLGIYFIQDGKIKVFSTNAAGKTQIVRFATTGHIIGHKGLSTNDIYSFGAAALEDSTICHINNELLNQLFTYNTTLVLELMNFYSRELRKAEERIKNVSQMTVKEKIVDALLTLYAHFGLNKRKELNVQFSREDIACTAGSTIPQVATYLTELENEGLIERRDKKIIALINLSGLQEAIAYHNPHLINK